MEQHNEFFPDTEVDSFKANLLKSFESKLFSTEDFFLSTRKGRPSGIKKSSKMKLFRPKNLHLNLADVETQVTDYVTSSGNFFQEDLRITRDGIQQFPSVCTQSQVASQFSQFSADVTMRDGFPSVVEGGDATGEEMDVDARVSPAAGSISSLVFDHPGSPHGGLRRKDSFNARRARLELRFDDLEVVRKLGTGASSSVYLMRRVKFPPGYNGPRFFADKVMKLDKTQIQYMAGEVQSLFRCRKSAHVVTLYDAFFIAEKDEVHLVLEYMDGNSLRQICQRRASQTGELVLATLAFRLLNALRFIHEEKKIVHRDIKPDNILISFAGEVKLSDFGLTATSKKAQKKRNRAPWAASQAEDVMDTAERQAMFDSMKGTVLYMSPQMLQNKPYNFASDVWSCGITLIEICLGRYPFPQDSIYGYMEVQDGLEADVGPLLRREGYQGVSDNFISFLSKMLTKQEERRATARQLLNHPFLARVRQMSGAELKDILRRWMPRRERRIDS